MSDLISREALYEATKDTTDVSYMAAMILCAPAVEAVEVVRCKDCVWWCERQVRLKDGTCRDYLPDEPFIVALNVGINVGSHCTKHGFKNESGSWVWSPKDGFCSYGERRESEVSE